MAKNYDEIYQNPEVYGSKPNPLLQEMLPKLGLLWQSKVLDLGCGQGRDFKYLQDWHFEVQGIDQSQVAINQIRSQAFERFLKLGQQYALLNDDLICSPIENIDWFADPLKTNKYYDLINFENTSHFLKIADFWKTMKGVAFTSKALVMQAMRNQEDLVFRDGKIAIEEVRNYFKDWQILKDELVTKEDQPHPGNEKVHIHECWQFCSRGK
ncbi:MAG TPA: class I SAM-dependent methyltransferase [Candidatus Gracilibacteria bacterium]|nr:class I SAM-dependent methyltransferase [Candidatus Gracilibacteria bacterium]